MSIRFFSTGEEQWKFLSNFYPATFYYQGEAWFSSEHFYQAMKFIGEGQERVRQLPTPAETKRFARQNQHLVSPDLLIVDIGLPPLDGFDVIKLFRNSKAYDRTPIVVLSRRDGVLDRLKAHLAGANAYIIKPFQTQDLTSTVRQLLPYLSTRGN